MAKKMGAIAWILSLLILVTLISAATISFFDFNIIEWLSFGIIWIEYILAGIVGVLGIVGLIMLVTKTLKR